MSYKYGEFLSSGEFKITDPDTPQPWINYLTNGDYCSLISQHGGGYSFYVDPARNGVLRREITISKRDCPGRFLYIVDEENQYLWSPNRVPTDSTVKNFECIHRPGMTTVKSEYEDIETEIKYFVPPDEDHEIWNISIRNLGQRERKLRVISFSDWMMGNTERGAVDLEWDHLSNEVSYLQQDVLLGRKRHWETQTDVPREVMEWPLAMYKTSTRTPDSWEADRERFFGSYRGFHNPQALELSELGEHEVSGGNAMGAFDWHFELPGHSEECWSCILGVMPKEDVSSTSWEEFQRDEYVDTELDNTLNYWDERLNNVNVSIPNEDLEHLVNTWLPYQVTINTWFGRAPSYWHSSQGYTGFRDACHEAFGVAPFAPEDARDKLRHILSFTYESGLNSHRTPRGARDYDRSNNADDPLWVPLALHAYLRETGDWEFLDEQVGYLDSNDTASVLEHMIEGVDYVLTQRGERGLPLIRYGDWNDALNTLGEDGDGESVWIGQFLYWSLKLAADICRRKGREDKADLYRDEADDVKEVINEQC